MIQQVIYPKSKNFTLELEIPKNWIGKKSQFRMMMKIILTILKIN